MVVDRNSPTIHIDFADPALALLKIGTVDRHDGAG
jgi:hypothetical protein